MYGGLFYNLLEEVDTGKIIGLASPKKQTDILTSIERKPVYLLLFFERNGGGILT